MKVCGIEVLSNKLRLREARPVFINTFVLDLLQWRRAVEQRSGGV